MSKRTNHPYRAHPLNGFDWSAVFELVEDQQVILGVDVAKEGMVAAVMDEGENVVKTIRWSHPRDTESLLAFVSALAERSAGVVVAMEPSGVYGDALRWQLLDGAPPTSSAGPS